MRRPRALSLPSSPTYRNHVSQVDIQIGSRTHASEHHFDVCPSSDTALNPLYHLLRSYQVDVCRLTFERFKKRILVTPTPDQHGNLLTRLLHCPMQVSNRELKAILQMDDILVEGTSSSLSTNDRAHRFYCRSWVFRPSQLLQVVQVLRDKGFTSSTLEEWEFQCCVTVHGVLTVRYIGMIKGRRDFVQRSQLDIDEKSGISFFGAFRDAVKKNFPVIHGSIEIHELRSLEIYLLGGNEQVGNQLIADDTERLSIQLFGAKSLLNLQSGGQYVSYLPGLEDEKLYNNIKKMYLFRFMASCTLLPAPQWAKLSTWFKEIESHARKYPEIYHFQNNPFKAMQDQARPYQYLGATIMIFLGEELSRNHFNAGHTFWDGPASSSVLVKNLITRIQEMEKTSTKTVPAPHGLRRAFTFVNASPLPKYGNVSKSLEFLKHYIQCIRPMILVSFGLKSYDAIASKMQTFSSKKAGPSPLTDNILELSIRNYGPNKNDFLLHIALNHPGKYQYGDRNPGSLRLFYIKQQITFLTARIAMEIVEQQSGTSSCTFRKSQSFEILKYMEAILSGQEGLSLQSNRDSIQVHLQTDYPRPGFSLPNFDGGSYLRDLRDTLRHRVRSIRHKTPAHDAMPGGHSRSLLKRKADAIEKVFTCPVFGLNTFDALFFYGRAHGKPHSKERIAHLERLWSRNLSKLHMIVPRQDTMYDAWANQFIGIQQGQSYLLKVLGCLSKSDYITALSSICNSSGRHKKRFDGISESTEFISGLWVSRKDIRAYRAGLSPRVKIKDIQGFPVEVRPDGDIKIRWYTSAGDKRTITLEGITCAVPKSGLESRALSFTENGVDIVNASGQPLRPDAPWEKTAQLATVPRWTFKTKSGQILQELWESVRLELGHKITEGRIIAIPPRRNGVGLVRSGSKTETPRQNRPPTVKDANYLLYHFLNERFPEGGVFRTASRSKVPDSTEDLQAFVEFCQRPANINHPYSAKWLEMLDRERPFVAILGPNLRVYRECETRVTYPTVPGSGHRTETIFILGPPVPIGQQGASNDVNVALSQQTCNMGKNNQSS